jgi:hypothetical protein
MKTLALALILTLSGCVTVSTPPPEGGDEPATPTTSVGPSTSTAPKGQSATQSRSQSATRAPEAPDNESTEAPAEPAGPRDWGTFEDKQIRPGVLVEGCTSNFLYHSNHTRYFLGVAAHCFLEEATDGNFCGVPPTTSVGAAVTVEGRDGIDEYPATLSYNSATAMDENGETSEELCRGNDFALVELAADTMAQVHPAVIYYGGPTALQDAELAAGSATYSFGSSTLRTASGFVHHELLGPQEGKVLNYEYGNRFIWTDSPARISGDSGTGLLSTNGAAVAVASQAIPTQAGWSIVGPALDYAEAYLDIPLDLVLWAEFSADGIEPLRIMGQPVP